jgi:hypothetical protein
MKYLPVIVLLVVALMTAGCTTENPKALAPSVQTITRVPATVSPPSQTYKTVDLVITLPNIYPAYGFRMDYPSEWSYKQEHSKSWRAGYNFSSPDANSYVFVYVDDTSGTANYWYPLNKWTDNVIKSLKSPYCLDNDAKPKACSSSANARDYHRRILKGNDAVTIQGAFEARKLVFRSNDDPNYGQETVYVMHAGTMQGYNFTVPDHYEVGVKADGPVWDYGVGGQGYIIDFYAPADQVDSTSEIFDHMIKSFKVTP